LIFRWPNSANYHIEIVTDSPKTVTDSQTEYQIVPTIGGNTMKGTVAESGYKRRQTGEIDYKEPKSGLLNTVIGIVDIRALLSKEIALSTTKQFGR